MTICLAERDLFIDMLAMEGSHESQKLLIDSVIYDNGTVEDTRRVLFHCIALKNPLPVCPFSQSSEIQYVHVLYACSSNRLGICLGVYSNFSKHH